MTDFKPIDTGLPEPKLPKKIDALLPPPSTNAVWETSETAMKNRPGLWESIAGTGSLAFDIGYAGVTSGYKEEAQYGWQSKNPSEAARLLDGIPPEYWDDILAETSPFNAELVRQQVQTKMAYAERVSQGGTAAMLATIGVGIGEAVPLAWLTAGTSIPSTLAGGVRVSSSVYNAARVFNASQRAVRAAEIASSIRLPYLMAVGGLQGSLSGVAYTAIDQMVDPTVEGHDYMMAGLIGGAVGSVANGLFGRSIIKSDLLRRASIYEERMFAAGKEGRVRFGADDIVQSVATRFNMNEGQARAWLVGQRAFGNPINIDLNDIAIAGPKARVTGRVITQEIFGEVDGARFSVQTTNDGKMIIRALNEAKSPKAFLRSIAEVVRRRLYNEDNPTLTNSDVVLLDDVVGARVPRTVPVTQGVEEGVAPAGVSAWEIRWGENLKPAERAAVKPLSDAAVAARRQLVSLRDKLRATMNKLESAYNDAVEAGTEADTFENFVRLENADAPAQLKNLRKEARRLAREVAQLEADLRPDRMTREQGIALRNHLKEELEAARKRLKEAGAPGRAKMARAKRAVTAVDEKAKKELEDLAAQETELADRLKRAETLLGELDREYAIRRRTAPFTNAEAERFADTFLRWLKNDPNLEIPAQLIPVFKKIRESLTTIFTDATDPAIGAAKVHPDVEAMFRDVFNRNLAERIAAQSEVATSAAFDRIAQIAAGVSVGPPASRVPPTSGTLPNDWSDAPYVNVRVLGYDMAKIPGLNRGVAAMNRGIGAVRWLGNRMMWARVHPVDADGNPVVQRATIMEKINQTRGAMEARAIRAYKAAWDRYASGIDDPNKIPVRTKIFNGWRHSQRAEFAKAVHDEILTPGLSNNKAVKDAAEAMRTHFDRMRQMAEDVGLPGFVGLEPNASYFPRLWRWETIDQLTVGDDGVMNLARLIRESIRIPIVSSVDDPEFIAGRAITAEGRDALAQYMAERLRQLARGEKKNAYLDMDEVMLEVLREQGMNTKSRIKNLASGPYMTPRGRRRIPLDITTEVRLPDGRTLSLSNLVSIDPIQVMTSYNRSVFGAIGEKILIDEFKDQLIARGELTLEEAADKIKNWADVKTYIRGKAGRGVSSKEIEAQIEHLDEIMAAIRHEPAPSWGSMMDASTGRILKLTYLQRGQGFGLANLVEFGRVIGRSSFRSISKQMPIIRELAKSAGEGRIDREKFPLLYWADHALGIGSERLRRAELGIVDARLEQMAPEARQTMWSGLRRFFAEKIDPNLNQATVFFSDITGLAPITSSLQHMMAASIVQETFEAVGRRAKTYSDALLNQWGVTRAEFEAIVEQLRTHGKVDAKGRVIDVNASAWDQKTYNRFLDFLYRGTISSIQDPPSRGDFAKGFWNPMGRMLTQFKTFNLKGVNNFLMTATQRKDARVFREYMYMSVLGMLTQIARRGLFYPVFASDEEKNKYYERSFSDKALIGYAVSGPTENYLLTSGFDTFGSLVTGGTLFSESRYSSLQGGLFNPRSVPGYSLVEDSVKSVQAISQSILRSDRDFSRRDLNTIFGIVPMGKMVPIFYFLNGLENGTANMFDLPETPRQK